MSIKIYNTLTRNKEEFEPINNNRVGIYLCGPTVYKPSHIGHAVGPVIFDAVRRWLEYRGFDVKLVVNITDVDDKIIAEANRLGTNMKALAERITADYLAAMKKLNVRQPDIMPKATEHIPDIIEFIEKLIEKGYAYQVGGDVYFEVSKFSDYGKLSRQSLDKQSSGTRELKSSCAKRHPADFALWKSAKPDEPAWNSPWGQGRPGWHIECSVMSIKHIGETIDIHGGGMDLIFPHHENEIAQSEALTGKQFVKYWMHNGLTRVNTKKMSKSLGNIRLLSELLEEYSGEVIRFFILSTHYRRPIDFSDDEIKKVAKGLQTFYRLFERVEEITDTDVYEYKKQSQSRDNGLSANIKRLADEFDDAMDDDFNTAEAIASLFKMANEINSLIEHDKIDKNSNEKDKHQLLSNISVLLQKAQLLGLFETRPSEIIKDDMTENLIMLLIEVRNEARKQKQFAIADMIRDKLADIGIQLKDSKDGTKWERKI